jgi:GT2 family glycosyltransferase
VLLCIRGLDPSLRDCLDGLFHQDYPQYDICVILDNPEDPASELVSQMQQAQTNRPAVKVCVLRERQETCSLKVSALVQAIRELKTSTEIVALIDADVVPYRHWLRDLVRPLANPHVGATCGVRWYMPYGKSSLGTLVRSLWNAVACTQMAALHIPWAGSMAFRAELFRRSELLDRWARSLVEDAVTYRVLRSLGLDLCLVPEGSMVSHEPIALNDSFRFIRRQLLNTRLYHESWPVIVAVSIGTPLALGGAVWVAAMGLWSGQGWLAAGVGVALAAFLIGMAFALSWTDRQINRLTQARGGASYPYPWRMLLAGLPTQAVHLASLLAASFAHKVEWRGITYEVSGTGRVRLLEYRPYQRTIPAQQANAAGVRAG